MSNQAQRVLDALMESQEFYPINVIGRFWKFVNSDDCPGELSDNYESLTADEEKQVIEAFLEFAY